MDVLGLLSIVLAIVLSALWWSLYDATHPPPEAEQDPFRSLATLGIFVGSVPGAPPTSAPASLDYVLAQIGKAGGYAAVPEFVQGAKQAYEMIVAAVARDDVTSVQHLLTAQVARDFRLFTETRRQKGEIETLTFIGFEAAEVTAASLEDYASVDVRFCADIVSVTRDREGSIVQGRVDRVVRVSEVWTFERDLTSSAPRWLLAATDSDE